MISRERVGECMVIVDFHVHINESKSANVNGIPVKMDRKEILKAMKKAGVDMAVLLVMAKKGEMTKTKKQNDWLSDICRENPRFVGFGSIHPGDGKPALKEMDRCVEKLGLKGFKLHPNNQQFDCGDQTFVDVLKQAAKLNVPVLIDSYSPFDDLQPSKLLDAVSASPDTKLCLAHVGMFRFTDFAFYGFIRQNVSAIKLNVWFDLSCSINIFYKTPFQDQFRWVTEQMGPDRLLFGSDFPGLASPQGKLHPSTSIESALQVTRNFGYPKSWIPKILGKNAAELLNI